MNKPAYKGSKAAPMCEAKAERPPRRYGRPFCSGPLPQDRGCQRGDGIAWCWLAGLVLLAPARVANRLQAFGIGIQKPFPVSARRRRPARDLLKRLSLIGRNYREELKRDLLG
jgi:hypothetical protein